MAPTSVFSYFRNHRRTGSSPLLAQSSAFKDSTTSKAPPSPARSEFATSSTAGRLSPPLQPPPQPIAASSSPISAQPPILPPIQRVASVTESRRQEPGSIRRPPRGVRSTTSPVLPSESPRRWAFEDVPEEEQEEESEQHVISQPKDTVAANKSVNLISTTMPQSQGSSIAEESKDRLQAQQSDGSVASQPPSESAAALTSLQIDFGDDFRLHSLDLRNPAEESPISPTQPALPIQPRKRSLSPKKHWTSPPMPITANILPSHRPISDDAGSSGSSLSSANRSYSAVTLNPDPASYPQISPVTTLKPTRQRKSILNPMNLLLRRRTSQGLDQDPQIEFAPFGTVIRGKGVHDFDKPRPRRNLSTNDLEGYGASAYSRGDVSPVEEYKRRTDIPWSTTEVPAAEAMEPAQRQSEQEHAPMFREHFDEDSVQTDSAVRREELTNQAFLNRVQENVSRGSHSPSPPPQIAKEVLDSARIHIVQPEQHEELPRTTTPNPPAINIIEGTPNPENDTARMFPGFVQDDVPQEASSEERKWQLDTPTPRLHRPSEASDTSRFSFIPGDSSAEEERKLEQRHMEKMSQERIERPSAPVHEEEEAEDESDEDYVSDYGEEGSFYNEESVPEIGGDSMLDDDQTVRRDVNMPANMPTSTAAEYPPNLPIQASPVLHSSAPMQHGLGLMLGQDGGLTSFPSYIQSENLDGEEDSHLEDDMYFDDGLIGEPSPIGESAFDESMFDRESEVGKALPSASGQIAQSNASAERDGQDGRTAASNYLDPHDSATGEDGDITPVKKTSHSHHHVDTPMHQSKLDAYHSALASATAKAEASGRFNDEAMSPLQRYAPGEVEGDENSSQLQYSQYDYQHDQQQAPVYWQPSLQDHDQPYWQDNDYDDFDPSFDFNSDDIAAANAEALAADDSGFYGREFGTFFGNAGNNAGLIRNKSVREPILTPITERSEFSRAPSFMSMGSPLFGPSSFVHGPQGNSPALPSIPFHSENGFLHPSSPALQSPGLRELAGRVGLNHDDLTLKQLMKLRQDALGTAGMSPVTGHGQFAASGSSGLLSPNAVGVLTSSPLAGRSANLPSSSPMNSAHSFKIGSVPDSAKRKTLRSSSLGTAIVNSSPPRVGSPGSDNGGYFAPDSPSSPFSHTSDTNNAPRGDNYDREYAGEGMDDEEEETDYDQFDESDAPEVSSTPAGQDYHPNMTGTYPSNSHSATPEHAPINPALRSHPITHADLLQLGEMPLDSRTATPVPVKATTSSSATPPPSLLEKFAVRPPASSMTFEEREAERERLDVDRGGEHEAKGVQSVAYVKDEHDGKGRPKWYVERRKTLESGEVLVLGREEVVGGI